MKLAARERAAALRAQLVAGGAVAVDPAVLLPAETLLDLYGEEIRARAYVTQDPAQGEMMLRPDFTVPVVQMHMAEGAEPARYTYAGEVFRRQEDHPGRPNEYLQVGFEIFDRTNPAGADAEVFATFAQFLERCAVRPVTGDIGILTAAVAGLRASQPRRSALLRHLWRPRRFRALLDRYAGRTAMSADRAALLRADDPFAKAGPLVGLRSRTEIAARIEALRADAEEGPLSADQVALIDAVLSIKASSAHALAHLRDIAVDLPSLSPALERFERRMDALQARGIDAQGLDFEASFGRTSMEYYDGFVFGFLGEDPELPPVATGGRYDALTQRLGDGREIPAVGGVVRPDILLALEGRA